MLVLTNENTVLDTNIVPDIVEDLRYVATDEYNEHMDKLRYGVLDYSDQHNVDFYFVPLLHLDRFPRPAADLKVGPYRLQVPLDWSIVIADKNMGSMEIIEIQRLNDREFDAFCLNPLSGYMPEFHEITIDNIFPDVSWTLPKLKHGHLLAVPLTDKPGAPCVYLVRDTNKVPEVLDITKIIT